MARRIEQVFDEAAQPNPTGGDKKSFYEENFLYLPEETENNTFTNCNPLLTHRVVAYKT